MVLAMPVLAADTGKDGGLIDLEERIAELESTAARKGNRKVSLTVTGEINKAILFWRGDGDGESGREIIDNAVRQSRFGFVGEARISPEWKAGYVMEIGLGEEIGFAGMHTPEGVISVRHNYLYLEHSMVGRVALGHTSMATDGVGEISLANTQAVVKMLSLAPVSGVMLGGLDLPHNGARAQVIRYDSASLGGFIASAAWGESESWDAALKYAGEFSGFRLAAGIGYRVDGKASPATYVYDATVPDFVTDATGGDTRTVLGSASVMHVSTGLFLSGAYGRTNDWHMPLGVLIGDMGETLRLGEVTTWHAMGGIERKFFDLGRTTIFGEWMQADLGSFGLMDSMLAGKKVVDDQVRNHKLGLNVYGFGVVQAVDAAALDIYANWRRYQLDGISAEDIEGICYTEGSIFATEKTRADVFMVGARIKF